MNISRRDILRALGVGAAAAPFVPALDAWAAPAAPPKRLLLLFSSSGTVADSFWPTGGEKDFTFAPGSILEPLAAHKDDLLIVNNLKRNLQGTGGQHERGTGTIWSGGALGPTGPVQGSGASMAPSIDQIIGNALPLQTDFRTIEAGVQVNLGFNIAMSYMISKGNNQHIPPENSPYKLFDRLFGAAAGSSEANTMDRLRAERQSAIDLVRDELAAVSMRVSATDRRKIDAHLEAVRGIERRLQQKAPAPGGACGTRPAGQLDPMANDQFPAVLKLHMDLLVSAFACDRTRIASLQCSRGFSGTRCTWVGVGEGHHNVSHEPVAQARPKLIKINRWYAEQLAYLIGAMKKVPDGSGTLLDNTLIVYANELNEGLSHVAGPTPLIMAGRLGGAVKTGRYLDYGPGSTQTHNGMLTAVCHLMGVPVAQVGAKDWTTLPTFG